MLISIYAYLPSPGRGGWAEGACHDLLSTMTPPTCFSPWATHTLNSVSWQVVFLVAHDRALAVFPLPPLGPPRALRGRPLQHNRHLSPTLSTGSTMRGDPLLSPIFALVPQVSSNVRWQHTQSTCHRILRQHQHRWPSPTLGLCISSELGVRYCCDRVVATGAPLSAAAYVSAFLTSKLREVRNEL
jgi:hypothetical protein